MLPISSLSQWTTNQSTIMRNLYVISSAWVLLFTAFSSMAVLQSSLNSDKGLGTLSLSTIYVTLVTSCLFVPPLVVKRLGIRKSIMISQCGYLFFIAANVYPKWYLLIPAAALVGIAAGPLWTAKCTYLTEIAGFYARLSGETAEQVLTRFFGIFFAIFQVSHIVGNFISSSILKPDEAEILSFRANLNCGAKDCPSYDESSGKDTMSLRKPQLTTVYLLCAIYIVLGIMSVLLIKYFLKEYQSAPTPTVGSQFDLLISTITQMKNKYQILIIPITLWMGFSLAYVGADYTKSFVACTKGVDKVGYVMIAFGLCNALGSFFFGRVATKYIGRVTCLLWAAAINYTSIIVMLTHELSPDEDNNLMIYGIAAMWGLADSAWQTQINSLYGVLFRDNQEAAFSNFRLWESLGFAISFAYSPHLCISTKLYLLIFYLTFGLICYLIIEFIEHKRMPKSNNFTLDEASSIPKLFSCLVVLLIVSAFFFF